MMMSCPKYPNNDINTETMTQKPKTNKNLVPKIRAQETVLLGDITENNQF